MSKINAHSEEFKDLKLGLSSCAARIQNWIFEAWGDLAPGQMNAFAEEVVHVRTVASLMAVLAPGRGLDPELAEIIGLLHDAGRLRPGGVVENHAKLGADEVEVFLNDNQLLTASSRRIVVNAIRHHSAKGKKQDAYDELLKDADVFQRLLEGEPILSKPSWRKRSAVVLEELRHQAMTAGDHTLVLSPQDQTVQEGYIRFLSEVDTWLEVQKHHVLDEKSVHDFRVFIRQTKALQSLFKPLIKAGRYERGQKLLRKALHTFEAARESAVELKAMEAYAETLEPGSDNDVRRIWIARRSEALARGKNTGDAGMEDFTWVTALQSWHRNMRKATLVKSVSKIQLDSFALNRISLWLRQWIKDYAHLDFDNDTSVHESRIDGKKLRYVIRALEKTVSIESGTLLEALESYQTVTGALHDVAVSKDLLAKEVNASHSGEENATPGFDEARSEYLSFREQQGREYRDQLRRVHGRLTEEIEAWLRAL